MFGKWDNGRRETSKGINAWILGRVLFAWKDIRREDYAMDFKFLVLVKFLLLKNCRDFSREIHSSCRVVIV